jgi:hypothetical protein
MMRILITRAEKYLWSTAFYTHHPDHILQGVADEHAAGLRFVQVQQPNDDANARFNEYNIIYEVVDVHKFMMEMLKYGIQYTTVEDTVQ